MAELTFQMDDDEGALKYSEASRDVANLFNGGDGFIHQRREGSALSMHNVMVAKIKHRSQVRQGGAQNSVVTENADSGYNKLARKSRERKQRLQAQKAAERSATEDY